MTQQRVYFGDIKPYAAPESLEDLYGPSTGIVSPPMWVYWAPGERTFDVGTFVRAKQAYTAMLSEGVLEEVCEIVNATRLTQLWASLVIPRRAAALWSSGSRSWWRARRWISVSSSAWWPGSRWKRSARRDSPWPGRGAP